MNRIALQLVLCLTLAVPSSALVHPLADATSSAIRVPRRAPATPMPLLQLRPPVVVSKGDSLTWQQVPASGDAPLYALRDGVLTAPDGSGIWVLGRARDASIGAWWFDLRRSEWRCIARRAISPRGWLGWGAIDPARGVAHFIGATSGAIGASASFDLDLVTGAMTQPPVPPRLFAVLRAEMRVVRDPVLDRLILFGGNSTERAIPCDAACWFYPLEPRSRDLVHPLCYDGGGPPPMLGHSLVFDTRRRRMLVIGGSPLAQPALPLWALDLEREPHWHALGMTPSDALGMIVACAVYDSARDAVWMLGGRYRHYPVERGTWRLQLGANVGEWNRVPASATGPELGTIMAAALSRPGGDVVAFVYGPMGAGLRVWRLRIPEVAIAARSDTLAAPVTADTVAMASAPIAFALDGAASEPLRGPLVITFALPTRAPSQLELFDVAGRRLAAREVGALGPGRHAVRLDDQRALASGVYFVRLRDPVHSAIRRVTVLR